MEGVAGGKWNSILGGEQGGASPGPDWLTTNSLIGGPPGVPSVGMGHKGRKQPPTERLGASVASSDCAAHVLAQACLPPGPHHHHA